MSIKQAYKALEAATASDTQSVTVLIPGLIPSAREGEFILQNVKLSEVHSEGAAEALGLDIYDPAEAAILDQLMALRAQLLLARMLAKRMEVTGIY